MHRSTALRAATACLLLGLAACTDADDPSGAPRIDVRPGPWPVLTAPPDGWTITWVDESLDPAFPPEERYVRYRGELDGVPVGLGLETVAERLSRVELEDVADSERAGTWSVAGERVRVWRTEVRGTTYWTAFVERRGSHLRVDAEAGTTDADDVAAAAERWPGVVASLRLASRADLERQVADEVVTPREERAVVRRALAGTPLPPDLTARQVWRRADGQPLRGTGLRDWETESEGAAEVADVVACGWWVRYLDGGAVGREAEEQLVGIEDWGVWDLLTHDQQQSLQRDVDRRERTRLAGFCD